MKKKNLLLFSVLLLISAMATGTWAGTCTARLTKVLPSINITAEQVRLYVETMESKVNNIRPGNQSQVYYANESLKNQTEYCLLYLHGFSACGMEGSPTHKNLGQAFGMNVYVPRLAEHGLETPDALLNMTPENLWDSALEALVLAKALGKKVIVMGTSTGGTLALQMAATFPTDICALILYSPNVRINAAGVWLLGRPLGLQLGRLLMGGKYRILDEDPVTSPYWYSKYRVEGVVYLQKLIEKTMKVKTFRAVTQPVFTGYYYRDKDHQDPTVKVSGVLWMTEHLGTPAAQKVTLAFPDAGAHVIGCELTNPNWMKVYTVTAEFIEKIIGVKPLK